MVASMGADIGLEMDMVSADPQNTVFLGFVGTLGGYIELEISDGKWEKFGVTNYHCIRPALQGWWCGSDAGGKFEQKVPPPPPPSGQKDWPPGKTWDIKEADAKGIPPGANIAETIRVESPSWFIHNTALQFHQDQINYWSSKGSKVAAKEVLTYKKSVYKKETYWQKGYQQLGCLLLASGFKEKTVYESTLDIALLSIKKEKMGDNTIPDRAKWDKKWAVFPEACGNKLNGIATVRDKDSLGAVFKVGATTGASVGIFNCIKSDIHLSDPTTVDKEKTTEWVFVARASQSSLPPFDRFADHGDSGSFVFTSNGEWGT